MKYIKTYEQSKGITFKEWLKNNPKDLNTVYINCSYSNLIDLDGIGQFTNLKELLCSNNKLTSLPDLPYTLEELSCSYNKLTSLPDLPDTLEELSCSDNELTSLPDLPDTLLRLYCPNNQLTSLPDLSSLVNLRSLFCYDNKLTSLPDLPDTLQILWCHNNQLPYYNLESYWKWFEETYPEKVAAKKYNL